MSFKHFTFSVFSTKMFFMSLCVLGVLTMQAQDVRTCWTNDYLEANLQEDPATAERMAAIEKHTAKYIDKLDDSQKAAAVITIPTVVHVIYNTSAQNISDAQIQSQMQVLNDDFRRQNADASNTPSAFAGVAADTEIEFCLATVDPNGNATTGITRTATNVSEFSTGSNCSASSQPMKFTSGGGKDAWATTDYLNMWVCNLGGGILGYAQFPGTGCAATDGVVMGYRYFGTIEQAQAPFDGGRTTTHEVGHWLNLRHIWGDGNCSADDFVSDTPASDAANYGCTPSHVSCNSTDMVQNYMDYSDDACMNLFTAGQKARMRAVLSSGGARYALTTSAGCGNGGGGGSNYCASQGNSVADEWIQTVALGSINNNSGSNGGYQDFTSVSTDLEQGSAYNFTLTPGYAGSAYAEYWKIFIDFNQDLDFDDSGEMVYDAGSASTTAVSGTLTIPASATLGNTRMRIVMKYTDGNDTAVPTACGSFAYGETEDYTVNITEASTAVCGSTSNLNASNISTSAATLSWASVSGASNYSVRYRENGASSWTTVTASSTSYSLSGLSASTTYEFQVKANCSNGVSSSYTSSASFTTDAPASCSPTSGLSTSNVADASATLNWPAVTGASNYTVRYRVSGTSSWTTASASSNSYNFSGLTNCTDYEAQVQVNCSNGLTSSYSSSATFSTTGCTTGGYCTSQSNSVADEWIQTIVLGSINNNSGSNGGYGDFTSIATDLEQGNAYNFTLTPGYAGTAYSEYWKIWIDFNNDNDFDDSGEEVFDAGSTSSTAVSGTLTIPTSATLGQTRMRIVMKYTDSSDADLPATCGSYAYGETEDYTVNITEAAPTCNGTSGLSSSNITENAASLSWNAVSGASYTVRYRENGGSWMTVSTSNTSYSLSGLNNCTDYEFQVKVNCSNGVSSSYSSSATFSTTGCSTGGITYCASTGENSSYFHISNVSLEGINNNTADDGGYGDYSSVTTELTTGDTYTISATEGTTYNYDQDWRVWIDYNADGMFSNDEIVLNTANTSSTTVSSSFTVPSNAVLGTAVGMRVSMKYFNIPAASQGSCDTFSYGEVEDYTITFAQGCGQASGLAASGMTETSATLGWSAVGGASSYNVRYRETNTSSWTTVSATSTSTSISGLTDCTNYEFQVQTICSASLSSAYSSSATFSTTGCTNISYCNSSASNSSYFHISNVTVGSINNNSGDDNGYGNYANVITDLGVGDLYTISATEGTTYNYDQDWRAWIDFNANGVFEASELVLDVPNTSNTTVSANFVVPANAVFGQVGMRVSMKYFNIPADSQGACDSFTYGEVEDYTINLVEGSGEINYCASAASNSNYFHISNVSVGSLNNNSGSDNGYGDYTNVSTTLSAGSTYTLSATEGTTYNYDQDWRAWIDFNGDGIFSSNEMVLDVENTSSTTVSSSFSVPSTASGEVRMRVSMKYYNIPAASQDACDSFTYGEVEDYTINISASGRTASSEKTILDNKMEIFPNPATDFVNINFEVAETSETVNISIYDITGRLVVSESKTAQNGIQSEQFDLSNFDEGYYIIKIETGETVMTKRLVVAK